MTKSFSATVLSDTRNFSVDAATCIQSTPFGSEHAAKLRLPVVGRTRARSARDAGRRAAGRKADPKSKQIENKGEKC